MPEGAEAFADLTEDDLGRLFQGADYVADDELTTAVYLSLKMGKPLLVEGEPGSGKTELGKVLAEGFETDLVRLQCYEGLAAEHALYEWNYTKQMLAVQSGEGGVEDGESGVDGTGSVFSEDYLFERPLLEALTHGGETPPVLLIDEVDRADEEFEAFLLEVLSDFQASIPEYGTVAADQRPVVVITSNRTRGLSDALKRRCLYLHVEPPSYEKERAIVRRKVPELDDAVARAVCGVTRRLREEPLLKQPGVAETLDWARALATLRDGNGDGDALTESEVRSTLGCLLKEVEDVDRVDDDLLAELVAAGADAELR
jgi:MoxR-like ATPase